MDSCCLETVTDYGRKLINVVWFSGALISAYFTYSNLASDHPVESYFYGGFVFVGIAAISICFQDNCLRRVDRLFNLDNRCLMGRVRREERISQDRFYLLLTVNCRRETELKHKIKIFEQSNDQEFLRVSSILFISLNQGTIILRPFMENKHLAHRVSIYNEYERRLKIIMEDFFPKVLCEIAINYAGPPQSLIDELKSNQITEMLIEV